jgi:hypothetical protein
MVAPADDPFYSPKRRVASAQRHLRNMDTQCATFFQSKPYARIVEVDADGLTQLHKIKLVNDFPDEIGDLAADTVDNLRSALDQTGYAAAVAAKQPRLKKTAFPFGETPNDVENAIAGWSKDVPSEITAFFRGFEPYKGGKGGLWALNQLCISNKHNIVCPVGTATSHMIFTRPSVLKAPDHGSATMNLPFWTPSNWDKTKNEIIIARVDPGGTFDADFQLGFDVTFGDVPIFANQSAVGTLDALISVVESVVLGAEAECRRLGFIS